MQTKGEVSMDAHGRDRIARLLCQIPLVICLVGVSCLVHYAMRFFAQGLGPDFVASPLTQFVVARAWIFHVPAASIVVLAVLTAAGHPRSWFAWSALVTTALSFYVVLSGIWIYGAAWPSMRLPASMFTGASP